MGHACGCSGPCDAAAPEAVPAEGDPLVSPDTAEILLFCEKCAEAFPPRFRRHCGHCGHDYGAGIAEEAPPLEPAGGRAILVALSLVFLAVACLAYFYYLFHRSSH
jgi:hypothetical protein